MSTKSVATGHAITLEFDLYRDDGTVIVPSSATVEVFDADQVLAGEDIVVPVVGNETVLHVTIPASYNVSDELTARVAVATIVGTINGQSTATIASEAYAILPGFQPVRVPEESAMSVAGAEVIATEIKDAVTEVWGDLSFEEKDRALRDAWSKISRMLLKPFRNQEERNAAGVTTRMQEGRFYVSELSHEEWVSLPKHFLKALRRAQFVEACVLSGGDPEWDRRKAGLISKTVGESSEMFNTKAIAEKRISERARLDLSGYISKRVKLSR